MYGQGREKIEQTDPWGIFWLQTNLNNFVHVQDCLKHVLAAQFFRAEQCPIYFPTTTFKRVQTIKNSFKNVTLQTFPTIRLKAQKVLACNVSHFCDVSITFLQNFQNIEKVLKLPSLQTLPHSSNRNISEFFVSFISRQGDGFERSISKFSNVPD